MTLPTETPTELAFLCPPELAGHIPHPSPAATYAPGWFTALPDRLSIQPDDGSLPPGTARACLPFSDAFALGWMLPLAFDLMVSRDEMGQLVFQWPDGVPFRPVDLMHPDQLGGESGPFSGELPLKFINPWQVRLPMGWSAAFLHPLNHFELPFTCFDAVVDCDALQRPVNIPFRWTTTRTQVVLPAGTPIAQVIPFQRRLAPPEAEIRAETPQEAEARAQAMARPTARPAGDLSDYARRWHRRHQTESPT